MSGEPSPTTLTQWLLMHVCVRPDRPPPDAWLEALVAADGADGLVRAAQRTMVAGLLWSALTPSQRDLLPEGCRERLQSLHLGNALRWQASRRLLIDCARRLAEAGIPVVALKGAALLLEVYADPGQRTISDLDLLVPEAQLGAAHRLLGSGAAHVGARHPERHLSTIHLQGEAGRIEVHGAASHLALWPHDGDPLADGPVIALDGAHVGLLEHGDLWLHLACHGLTHPPEFWPRMAADLARLQRSSCWDDSRWATIWGAACRDGWQRVVLLAAAVAGGGAVPTALRAVGVPDADCDRAAARALQVWGMGTRAVARDVRPWARRWIVGGPRRNEGALATLFPARAALTARLGIPPALATVLYPAHVLWRGLRLMRTGLAWCATLRLRHLAGLPEAP